MKKYYITRKKRLIIFLISFFIIELASSQMFSEFSNNSILFEHRDGRIGEFQFTETLGSGLAWVDINNDDFIDLFLISGDENVSNKLFLNKNGEFQDVTKQLKITSESKGMGVCSADINQDGWVDFLITNYGSDTFYFNNGGESFNKKSLDAESPPNQWSTSCAFADLDNDGDLDLYVTRYVDYQFNGNKSCQAGVAKGYCNPSQYRGQTDGLYLNDGNGNFNEVGKLRGISSDSKDRGLGVVISDFDQDGDLDIYVANDGSSNRLYVNNGKAFFKDRGLISGTAINQNGVAEASMGVALGDINSDLSQDIVVSHFSMETNTAYLNNGENFFSDSTRMLNLTQPSYMKMGWGIELQDFNNDGLQDLVVANGHIHDFIKKTDARQSYKQENQVFINNKNQFNLLSYSKAFSSSNSKSSRGLATADWNNDGKLDLAISNINDSVDVFENTNNNTNHWLGVKLVGNKANISAVGAVVYLKTTNNMIRKEVISGGSFMSQSDFRMIFGLGENSGPVSIKVRWPDGKKSEYQIDKLNQYHKIKYKLP